MLDYKSLFHSAPPSAIPALPALIILAAALLAACSPLAYAYASEVHITAGEATVEPSALQQAINSAKDQDTITLESGLYNGSIIIGKSIYLRGLDTGFGRPVLSPATGRIILAAPGAILQGFEIGLPAPGEECTLEVVLPAGIYLNQFSGSGTVCPEDAASWNSSQPLAYQYDSRVLRSRLGNYWSDYSGPDADNDGIGDQPVALNDKNIDYYPLMKTVDSYRISDEEETDQETIQAKLNQPFTISLPANPTTGYQWFVDYDYGLLREDSSQFESGAASLPPRVGAGGTSVFVFTPVQPGKTTIRFVYRRSWENIAADTRAYRVEISP